MLPHKILKFMVSEMPFSTISAELYFEINATISPISRDGNLQQNMGSNNGNNRGGGGGATSKRQDVYP